MIPETNGGKVVVDVKVTSTDKMNEAFKEKDEKYQEWETRDEGGKLGRL